MGALLRLALPLAVVAAVVLAAPYTFLPGLLERSVAGTLGSQLGTATPPEVELRSEPRWRMLRGEFSGGRVILDAPAVEGVSPDSVELDLEAFDVRVPTSLYVRRLVTERPIPGTVTAYFGQRTLSRIAVENAGDYPVRGVEVRADRLTVQIEPEVLGVGVPIGVGGSPSVEGEEFVFRPERVSAFGVPMPEDATEELLRNVDFRYPLGDLPYGPLMDEARVEGGRLVVSGRVANVLADPQEG